MSETRASANDRAYFARVARANAVTAGRPPNSLVEMFERLASMEAQLGDLARPGVVESDPDGDWESHRAFLARIRAVMGRAHP